MADTSFDVAHHLDTISETLGRVRERLYRPQQGLDTSTQANLYFRRLLEVSREMNSTLQLGQVLDVAISTLVEMFAAENGFLLAVDSGGELVFNVALNADSRDIGDATAEISHSVVEEVLKSGNPILVENALEDERFKAQSSVLHLELRSAMCVPLTGRDGVFGAIYIDHRLVSGRFSQGDLELLSLFANQVAIAIENARLFEAETRRAGGMELLYRVGRTALEQLDLEAMLRMILEEIRATGFGDAGAVLLTDSPGLPLPELPSVHLAARAGMSEALAQRFRAAHFEELGTAASAASTVDDLRETDVQQAFAAEGIRHLAVTFLTAGHEVLGILGVARRQVEPFTVEDLELLNVLGAEVGVAVHDRRLYQELQETNEELRRTQQMVLQEQRLRALGTMASGIAHDINNALTPIFGIADLLLTRQDWDEETRMQLEMIATSSSDIAATVARLREFYRKQDSPDTLQPVLVADLVQKTISLTQPRWRDMPQERGVVIEVDTEIPEDLPCVAGIEGELREALTNLILNAVDAMPEGGKLRVCARAEDARVALVVEDTGVGMTEEVRQRCLEPFFSTKEGRGTGMGLSVVYGIVNRLRGDIEILTAPGKGTTFTLLLPVAEIDLAEAELTPVSAVRARVLCIDDEASVREFLRRALAYLGHAVVVVPGGREGIEAFQSAPFDVVITDLGMPEVDGRVVTAAVKKQSPDTPVILLTGWGTRLEAEGQLPPGVDRVMCKPVSLRQLGKAVGEVFGQLDQEQSRELQSALSNPAGAGA